MYLINCNPHGNHKVSKNRTKGNETRTKIIYYQKKKNHIKKKAVM